MRKLFEAARRVPLTLITSEELPFILEVQTKFDKLNFILGGRAEDYNIIENRCGRFISFKQFRFFLMPVRSIILVVRLTST
jgi:hypothetical protein